MPANQSADDRPDDPKKSYRAILAQQILQAESEIGRRKSGLFLSGLSAGLDLGFGPLLIAVVLTHGGDALPPLLSSLLTAGLYTVGFVFVIFGRSELFTEHTTLAILPVLDRRTGIGSLLRLWGLIYVANLIGAFVFAWIIGRLGPWLGTIDQEALQHMALRMTDHPSRAILVSGILAGWLMGLLSWLVTAGRDTISQVFFVWVVTFSIGLAGLHHCIAGSAEVLPAVLAGAGVSLADFGRFLLWATLGNAFGGVVFVGILKYAHVAQSSPAEHDGTA